jgi:hypothetical protein
MPRYVVSSEGPIKVTEVHRPDLPDWEVGGGPIIPERPEFPGSERPGHGLPPTLPPRDEWPPLPPWLQPGVGLPIPPTVELPWVPIPEHPEVDPPDIWPPMPGLPDLPDLSGKTLVLARIYVSRHVNYLRWVVIDHAEAKSKLERAIQWLKDRMPAGGVGGRPPVRPGPGGD